MPHQRAQAILDASRPVRQSNQPHRQLILLGTSLCESVAAAILQHNDDDGNDLMIPTLSPT